MKSRGWEDNRRALLQYILTCEQYARTSAYKGAIGIHAQSIWNDVNGTEYCKKKGRQLKMIIYNLN